MENRQQVLESQVSLSETLPASDELSQVFKDFKQVLNATRQLLYRFLTPLQRANGLYQRSNSIALAQKTQVESDRVFNLLLPGHNTNLKVDLLRLVARGEGNIVLKVPITLLGEGNQDTVMLKNRADGRIVRRNFSDIEAAFQTFQTAVSKSGPIRPYLPRFVHKVWNTQASFHSTLDSALSAWRAAGTSNQQLQQFIQPYSKRVSLVRAHWSHKQNPPTFYFISQGPRQSTFMPCIVTKIPGLSRSFSESDSQSNFAAIRKNAGTLIVQRAKNIPELNASLQECYKLLMTSLPPGQKLTEFVCDFTSNSKHKWVFLGCKGFRFYSDRKMLTRTVKQGKPIDVKFLLFPVVARAKTAAKRQFLKVVTSNPITDGENRRLSVIGIIERLKNAASPLVDSPLLDPQLQISKPVPKVEPKPESRFLRESAIIKEAVDSYNGLIVGSRQYKEEVRGAVDYIEKYGGVDFWKPHLTAAYSVFVQHDKTALVFVDSCSFEEYQNILNGLMRVIRGNFNIYYKEAMKKVHQRKGISKEMFVMFVHIMEEMLLKLDIDEMDMNIILSRFRVFEKFICKTGE